MRDVAACVAGTGRRSFKTDRVRQLALVKAIENMGETAGDILENHPAFAKGEGGIPWRAWKNARNRLSHGYHSIDYDLVWTMAEKDVPTLDDALRAIADFDRLSVLSVRVDRTNSR